MSSNFLNKVFQSINYKVKLLRQSPCYFYGNNSDTFTILITVPKYLIIDVDRGLTSGQFFCSKEGLNDYYFSIAIENNYRNNAFSEKINDCFLTGTIPIYFGTPNIGNYFNSNGILSFSNLEELNKIMATISKERYMELIAAVKDNFIRAQKYLVLEDRLYEIFKETWTAIVTEAY